MAWWLWLVSILAVCFGGVLFFGAPYLPTLKKQTDEALDLIDLKPGQTLLELGAGDGRVMRAAARRGLTVVGIELNPLLCLVAVAVTWRYRKQVTVICGDFWRTKWPPADGIFVFLLEKYMPKLDKSIVQQSTHKVKVVSYTFTFPNRQPVKTHGPLQLYEFAGRSAKDEVA